MATTERALPRSPARGPKKAAGMKSAAYSFARLRKRFYLYCRKETKGCLFPPVCLCGPDVRKLAEIILLYLMQIMLP